MKVLVGLKLILIKVDEARESVPKFQIHNFDTSYFFAGRSFL